MKMTDEAFVLELAQVAEQLVDLLRDEHRRRLVEDHDPRAAVEHLEDLHPLPGADPELLDQRGPARCPGRRLSEMRRTSSRAPAPMPCSFSAPRTTFSSTVRLSASMKCWKTMPTPARMASAGECSVTCWPSISMVPGVGGLHAVEDLHQRGLAGAVLTHDGVDGAAAYVDVDVVVGDDAGEALADAPQAHSDRRRRRPVAAGARGAGHDGDLLRRRQRGDADPRRHRGPQAHVTGSVRVPPGAVSSRRAGSRSGRTVISPSMICCLYSSSSAGDVVDEATGGGVADAVDRQVVAW